MHRRLLAASIGVMLVASAVVWLLALPAFSCVWNPAIGAYNCGYADEQVNESAQPGSTGQWPPEGWVPVRDIQLLPDGNVCARTTWREPSDALGPEQVNPYDGGTRDPATYPECPREGAEAVIDYDRYVRSHWEAIPLPAPQPYVAPGWAITGKLAYLETRGQLRHTYSNSTPFGPLEITSTGVYHVDWGDGESTGPHSTEGKSWPEGEITHEYIWTGSYDIVVTERWTATWKMGPRSGFLSGVATTGRIDDFPVRQIQAVVR